MDSKSSSSNGINPASRRRAGSRLPALSIFACGILAAIVVFPRYVKDPSRAVQAACQNNLKQLALVLATYANDHKGGLYPALSSRTGTLAMKEGSVYPEYLSDLLILQCPATPRMKKWYEEDPPAPSACDDDQCYFYLGYRIPDQTTLEFFAQAYRVQVETGQSFEEDLHVKLAAGGEIVIPRLDSGSSRTTGGEHDVSDLPVLVERFPNRHRPEGGNVHYADGRVVRIRWGEKWPMTPEAMEMLLALDALGED